MEVKNRRYALSWQKPKIERFQPVFFPSFLLLFILRALLVYLSPLSLSQDEAQYWDWSRNLDLSYYSKGPVIAYLIRGTTYVLGDTEYGVRAVGLVSSLLFSLAWYVFVKSIYGEKLAFLSWAVIETSVLFSSQSLLATTDAPFSFFFLLALLSLYQLFIRRRPSFWPPFFVFLGLAVLTKYTALLILVSLCALFFLEKEFRKLFLSPFFFFGVIVFAILLSPIIIWNVEHSFANFSHNADHVNAFKDGGLTLRYFFELIGGQIGLFGLFAVFALALVVKQSITLAWRGDTISKLWLSTLLPLLFLCVFVSFGKRVYANWPMPLYLSLMLLMVHLLSVSDTQSKKIEGLFKVGIALNLFFLAFSYSCFLGQTYSIPGNILPTKKLFGWREAGEHVSTLLTQYEKDSPVLIADSYGNASALTFYVKGRPRTYCANTDNRRMNQYDIWGGWEKLEGRNAVIVLRAEDAISSLKPYFSEIVPLSSFQTTYSGKVIREFFVFFGKNYSGSDPPAPHAR